MRSVRHRSSFCFFSSARFLFVSSDSNTRMDAAVMPTADAIKTNHCGETDDKMFVKDCMVGKAQIRELREQNISQHRRTDRLRESCASRLGMYNKAYKIKSRIRLAYARSHLIAGSVAGLSSYRSGWCACSRFVQHSALYALVVMSSSPQRLISTR